MSLKTLFKRKKDQGITFVICSISFCRERRTIVYHSHIKTTDIPVSTHNSKWVRTCTHSTSMFPEETTRQFSSSITSRLSFRSSVHRPLRCGRGYRIKSVKPHGILPIKILIKPSWRNVSSGRE